MSKPSDLRLYRLLLILCCVAVLQRAPENTIVINVDPTRGSRGVAMGTQSLEPGTGIPVHRHEREDEVLFIHDGRGTAIVGDERTAVAKGDTIFIPRGAWHGVEPPKNLTPAQLPAVGLKHGVTFRPR